MELKKVGDQEFDLILKNEYTKSITAFAVSTPTYESRVDLLDSNRVIRPGAIYTYKVNLSNNAGKRYPSSPRQFEITVLALIFEDKTSDGNTRMIKAIQDTRSGEKVQTIRILSFLHNSLNLPESRLSQEFNDFKSRMVELPEVSEQSASVYFRSGLHNTRERILREIAEIEGRQREEGSLNLREEITRIKERHERKLAKL